jgi:hypothetical protein
MKRKSKNEMRDELRPEYDLGPLLKNGIQGKYAKRCRNEGTNVILLDPEVAKEFPTASEVNEALRLVIRLTRLSKRGETVTAKQRTAKVPR